MIGYRLEDLQMLAAQVALERKFRGVKRGRCSMGHLWGNWTAGIEANTRRLWLYVTVTCMVQCHAEQATHRVDLPREP